MLSWSDDSDVFSKKPSLSKAGSVQRPGNSFEAQRTLSSRKSMDVPAAPGSRKSMDTVASPTGSLNKANSILRGPVHAAEGTIGSEGWWHHMDHSQMNEPPSDYDPKAKSSAPAFVPQFGVTGQNRSLWADEDTTKVAPTAPGTSMSTASAFAAAANTAPSEPAVTAARSAPEPGPAAPAAPAPPTSVDTAVAQGSEGPAATIQNAAATGWWAHMDNSVLNQPAETVQLPQGAVQKGERVMGGGFTPQFNVAGGNRYTSIFADEQPPQPQKQPDGVTAKLEQEVEGWGPFRNPSEGAAAATAAAAAGGDEGWSTFTSATGTTVA